jgi:hypothetical protein
MKVIAIKTLRYIFGLLIFALIVGVIYAEEEFTDHVDVNGWCGLFGKITWTHDLPNNYTEITYLQINISAYTRGVAIPIYLNGVEVGSLDASWEDHHITTIEVTDPTLLQQIVGNPPATSLRVVAENGGRVSQLDIYTSDLHIKYKIGNDNNSPSTITKTSIPMPAIILVTIIITIILFRKIK